MPRAAPRPSRTVQNGSRARCHGTGSGRTRGSWLSRPLSGSGSRIESDAVGYYCDRLIVAADVHYSPLAAWKLAELVVNALADDHLAGPADALKSGGYVDGDAECREVHDAYATDVPYVGDAGIDADAQLQPRAVVRQVPDGPQQSGTGINDPEQFVELISSMV
jgi:hypothetical protein